MWRTWQAWKRPLQACLPGRLNLSPLFMSKLTGQIAVITGAGRGIGKAIALKFASEGADVVCVSRTPQNSESVAQEVRALGRKAWGHAADVSDAAAVGTLVEQILSEAGRVDILVNNAGVTRDGLLVR